MLTCDLSAFACILYRFKGMIEYLASSLIVLWSVFITGDKATDVSTDLLAIFPNEYL